MGARLRLKRLAWAALLFVCEVMAGDDLGAVRIIEGSEADPASSVELLGLRQFGTETGLPQMTVFALAEDAAGYVYAGTQDGLARWDGQRFERLPHRADGSDWVTHLLATEQGLWVGTDESGLHLWRDEHWLRVHDDAGQVLPSIEAIAPAAIGGVWIGTPNGLLHCDERSCRRMAETADLEIAELLEAADGTLWVGTNTNGLYRFDPAANGLRRGAHFDRSHGLPNDAIRALLMDQRERLWIGTGRGLARWDGQQMVRWRETGSGPLGGVFALAQLADGSVHAALRGRGLALFRPDDGYRIFGLRDGLPDSYVQALLITADPTDPIVWLGTASSGVLRLESGRWRSFDERHGLPQRVVVGVGLARFDEGPAQLWAGTLAGAVRWDQGRWLPLLPEAYRSDIVYELLTDQHGRRWYGTQRGVLMEQDGRWLRIDSDSHGLPAVVVANLLLVEDTLWIGTNHGLALYRDGQLLTPFADHDVYAAMAVRSMAQITIPQRGPLVLLGTSQGPLLSNGEWIEALPASCAPHRSIHDVEVLPNADVWLGTRAGAVRLRWQDGAAHCELIREPTGSATTVYQIAVDRQGRVYLFGYAGVRRIDDPQSPDHSAGYRRFGLEDGLPALEFNRDALVDPEGRVWAANSAGLVVYEPDVPLSVPRQAPLRLQVDYEGRLLAAGTELPASHSELLFKPRLLSFRQEHQIRYRTRLIGLDQSDGDWLANGDRRFPRIPPGSYRFRVEARDAAGALHGPVEFAFRVAAPWWQHPLSLLVAALCLLAAGLLAGRLRVRALARRALRLEAVVAERTRELALASNTDSLTGCWNRRCFHDRIAHWLDEDMAHGGALLLLIDIDHFKRINDQYGHAAGDAVLVEVARRLRTADQTGSEVIRWGGEEFLLLLRRADPARSAARVAAVLAAISSEAITVSGTAIDVSCSIGYTRCRPQADDIDQHIDRVIGRADEALYRAKHEGRNRAVGAV